MLAASDLRNCQHEQIAFGEARTKYAIFAEMGLGKSAGTATTVVNWLHSVQAVNVLIIGPKAVVQVTWPNELKNWSHLSWLKSAVLRDVDAKDEGFDHVPRVRYWRKKIVKLTEQQLTVEPKSKEARALKKELQQAKQALKYGLRALANPADIHLINWQNLCWLVHFWGKYWPYDTVVYDESSIGLKSGKEALVWRAMRLLMPYTKRLVLLSGTPMPKGLENLWGQIYLLDGGQRLGGTITSYREAYFKADYMGYKYEPLPGAFEKILDKISDLVLVQKSRDYLDLPETISNTIPVVLDDKARAGYEELQREYLLTLDTGEEITANAAAALTQKLLQVASGFVFDENKKAHRLHDAKLDALGDYLEGVDGNVLMAYWYPEDAKAICKRFPQARVLKSGDKAMQAEWNAGKIPLMLLHPQSGGHGLNIQFGARRILWYGPVFHTELYQQFNARLADARAVGLGTTFIDHLVVVDSVEEYVMEVLKRDGDLQEAALVYLKRLLATFS